jgi:hypothetical protein
MLSFTNDMIDSVGKLLVLINEVSKKASKNKLISTYTKET